MANFFHEIRMRLIDWILPKYKNSDYKVRMEAVKKLTSKKKLKKIARTDPYRDIRVAAYSNIKIDTVNYYDNNRRRGTEVPVAAIKNIPSNTLNDWTKIPTQSKFLKGLFLALNFIKIPAPAIEINGLGKLKGHWTYF